MNLLKFEMGSSLQLNHFQVITFLILITLIKSYDWELIAQSYSNEVKDIAWNDSDNQLLSKSTYACDSQIYGIIKDYANAVFSLKPFNIDKIKIEFDYQLTQTKSFEDSNGVINVQIIDMFHKIFINQTQLITCGKKEKENIAGSSFSVILNNIKTKNLQIKLDIFETNLKSMGIRNFKIYKTKTNISDELMKIILKNQFSCEDQSVLKESLSFIKLTHSYEPNQALQERESILGILEFLQQSSLPKFLENIQIIEKKFQDESNLYQTIPEEFIEQIEIMFVVIENSYDSNEQDKEMPKIETQSKNLIYHFIGEAEIYDRLQYLENYLNKLEEQC